jgi:N-ethylmaleimide reductase
MQPDAEMDALYVELIRALNSLKLAYVHVVDHSSMGAPPVSPELKAAIRKEFKGAYVLSGGYDLNRAHEDLTAQKGDLVAFGRPFLSNPNLPEKLKTGAALTAPDPDTFYTPGEKGYTDYR